MLQQRSERERERERDHKRSKVEHTHTFAACLKEEQTAKVKHFNFLQRQQLSPSFLPGSTIKLAANDVNIEADEEAVKITTDTDRHTAIILCNNIFQLSKRMPAGKHQKESVPAASAHKS